MCALPNSSHLFVINALTTGVPNSFVGAPLASSIASSRPLPIAPAVQCSAAHSQGVLTNIQSISMQRAVWCGRAGAAACGAHLSAKLLHAVRALEHHRLKCRHCT
jgi:hypothetical protein